MALAMFAKKPAFLTAFVTMLNKMAEDARAEGNPVKDIAVGFILISVALVIALVMLPVVTSAIATAQADPNVTGANDTLLGLIPTVLIVSLLLGGVAFLFRGFKQLRSN